MGALLHRASEGYALAYFGALIVVALLEAAIPFRPVGDTVRLRWLSNIGIAVLDTAVVRWLFPLVGVGWATFCSTRGWGFFNAFAVPAWFSFVVTVLVIDLLIYAQHFALHRVPLLWLVHRTHHTDQVFDLTTGVRFHPIETILGTAVTLVVILALGAPPVAVFAIQLLSVAFAFLEHANVRLAPSWDRLLRLIVVTPDMHRIHHSCEVREGNSNFSNVFPWWDRLFGTYIDQPTVGAARVAFGVEGFEDRKHLALPWMLAQPFLHADDQPLADPGRSPSPKAVEIEPTRSA